MAKPPEQSDEQLVSLSKDGDLDAFNRLVDRYQGRVFNLCLRLLGRPEAAEDATQDAFLSAFRALDRFAGGNFRSWLLRIAANQCKDELRRRSRKDRATSLDQVVGTSDLPLEIPDPNESATASAEQHELGETLTAALDTLPFDQRQAIVLVDVLGYRYEEAATVMDTSPGTVKSRIHRGRTRLRTFLTEHPELLEGYRRLEEQEKG